MTSLRNSLPRIGTKPRRTSRITSGRTTGMTMMLRMIFRSS
ncbi:hypothetical protein BC938DRAFT_476486 [Jimgerdemannia flammicorona]|uniref:Uncharacterized protein n=1 Tax=Jimgerdemannia flammicorona TaxID=994334 RepID=A0A433PGT0_9FUNG|nr:hypothetical protein BC938DRAFT_476486 [Jimgerdemannia flammicorona]